MNTKNYTLTPNPKYDLHLSAYAISPDTIQKLEEFGFVRDEFANNRYCDTTAYHGSFPGWQADTKKWELIIHLLNSDPTFNGGLEEEVTLPHYRQEFTFEPASTKGLSAEHTLAVLQSVFPKKKAVPCPATRLKACDMHINVNWEYSRDNIKDAFDKLGIVSFDKPDSNSAGFNRIYTMTFEDLGEGIKHFEAITTRIRKLNDTNKQSFIFGFVGKVKMEITTRVYRKPLEGILLPLILKDEPYHEVAYRL